MSLLNSVLKFADIQVDDTEEAVVYMPEYMQNLIFILFTDKLGEPIEQCVEVPDIQSDDTEEAVVYMPEYMQNLILILFTDKLGEPIEQCVKVRRHSG